MCAGTVAGLQSSDKYLLMHRAQEKVRTSKKSSKKLKKKSRRKRGKGGVSSDDEDEAPVAHQVSSTIEVPEGVDVSDNNDDGLTGRDDPHRMLDINLDE